LLQRKTLIEIRDLDQWTDEEEVVKAVATEIGATIDAMRVISLRERYGRTQTALILVPYALCRKLLLQGRLCVGIVSCKVRPWNQRVRCFRCLSFGHTSRDCLGPDSSKCCKRCRGLGHKAAVCKSSSAEARDFASKLVNEGPKDKEEEPHKDQVDAESRSAQLTLIQHDSNTSN